MFQLKLSNFTIFLTFTHAKIAYVLGAIELQRSIAD